MLSKGNEAMVPPYRFRRNARMRMNVIEGCPVEFARALTPLHPATYNRCDFYQNEKCALISVTLGVARL